MKFKQMGLQSFGLRPIPWLGCCFAILALSDNMALAQSMTNSVPKELLSPQTAWGEETNGLRAGMNWEFSGKMNVRVAVLRLTTNAAWNYVGPPGRTFPKCELRDARGVLVTPLRGEKLVGELPQRILTKDLPHSPPAGIHNPTMIENRLMLGDGQPCPIRDIVIQDIYRIPQEGDYTLTVWASIYEFAPDRQSVSRIDLPPVTAKIHLAAGVPSGTSPGMTTANMVGAALCVGGVVWLVAHRRRRNGENAGPQTAKAVTS